MGIRVLSECPFKFEWLEWMRFIGIQSKRARGNMKMKINIMLTAVLLLAGSLFALRAKTPPDNPEQQIRELEEKANGAYAANDLPSYFSYYAPDFSEWLPEGRTDLPTYQKDWKQFIQGEGRVESAICSDLHIQIGPSGDIAVARYSLHVRTRSTKGAVSEEDNLGRLLQAKWRLEDHLAALFSSSKKESAVVCKIAHTTTSFSSVA